MPALSGLIGLTLYHPFVPVAVRHTKGRQAGTVRSAPVRARDRRRTWAVSADTTRSWARMTGIDSNVLLGSAVRPSGWTLAVRIRCVTAPGRGTIAPRP